MNTKTLRFFFVLVSCFFFHFSYSETVFFITENGKIFNENECENKFDKISIRLEKEGIKDLLYDNATKLLIFFVDENNCTILHKIASKKYLSDTFDDFKKFVEKFTKKQIIEFVLIPNVSGDTILHEAAKVENIDFILDFIDWWGNKMDVGFRTTLKLFKTKNKDDKNFMDFLQLQDSKDNVINKIYKCIKYDANQEFGLDNFLYQYGSNI